MTQAVEAPARAGTGRRGTEAASTEQPPQRRLRALPAAIAVFLSGALITTVLVLIFASTYSHNERRLLSLRGQDVATVLTGALPSVQTPLASVAAIADDTAGSPAKFHEFIAPYVGTGPNRTFISVSLWRVADPAAGPVAVEGARPLLSPTDPRTATFLERASLASGLTVLGLLRGPAPRMGYGFTGIVRGPYAAYGESPLPPSRRLAVKPGTPFSDLDFAIYLGPSAAAARLLLASPGPLPLPSPTVTEHVPFGDRPLTVVVRAKGSLSGTLPRDLPIGLAVAGLLLSLAAAVLTGRLTSRRQHAERLAVELQQAAEENHRLYAEQRGIAQTLQHALLPESLPRLAGLESAARYIPGVEGVEVGGDWYDLTQLGDRCVLLVVGDVSGRGVRAATTMAALRHAIHAYSAQGDPPEVFLPKLTRLIDVGSSDQMATVLCALVDLDAGELTVTSAGHLPLLLISERGAEYVRAEVGPPVGVDPDASYEPLTVPLAARGTLLAYTDGLVERRDEQIDAGLERLRVTAGSAVAAATLDQLIDRVLAGMVGDAVDDDTAILGIRWG